MNAVARRAAFAATRAPVRSTAVSRRWASGVTSGAENAESAEDRKADKSILQKGAKRDPELYVRLTYWFRAACTCMKRGSRTHLDLPMAHEAYGIDSR